MITGGEVLHADHEQRLVAPAFTDITVAALAQVAMLPNAAVRTRWVLTSIASSRYVEVHRSAAAPTLVHMRSDLAVGATETSTSSEATSGPASWEMAMVSACRRRSSPAGEVRRHAVPFRQLSVGSRWANVSVRHSAVIGFELSRAVQHRAKLISAHGNRCRYRASGHHGVQRVAR